MYRGRQDSESVVEEEYYQKGDYCDGTELDRCSNLVPCQQLDFGAAVVKFKNTHNPSCHVDN